MGMQRRAIYSVFGALVATSVTIGIFGAGVAQQTSQADALGTCSGYSGLPAGDEDTAGMTFVAGGTFTMGSDQHQPEERFTHVTRVDGFWIDRHEVTRNSRNLSTPPIM
jgi:formylglycine-generating enzyme required for sulfatase activity